MAYTNPTVAEFQSQFVRDFPYNADPNYGVMDTDISNAQVMALANINQGLFATQTLYSLGFNLLSAHYLVLNLRASSQGLNGQYNWIQNTKSVSNVSEAFGIPERILANPYVSMLCKTNYGARYVELLLPSLNGVMFSALGSGGNPGGPGGGWGGGWGW